MKDFAFVAHTASFPLVLVVNPALPVKWVADLIRLAKEKPGQLDIRVERSGSHPLHRRVVQDHGRD